MGTGEWIDGLDKEMSNEQTNGRDERRGRRTRMERTMKPRNRLLVAAIELGLGLTASRRVSVPGISAQGKRRGGEKGDAAGSISTGPRCRSQVPPPSCFIGSVLPSIPVPAALLGWAQHQRRVQVPGPLDRISYTNFTYSTVFWISRRAKSVVVREKNSKRKQHRDGRKEDLSDTMSYDSIFVLTVQWRRRGLMHQYETSARQMPRFRGADPSLLMPR